LADITEDLTATGNFIRRAAIAIAGNIHSLSNSSEPVIGYISASTIPEKRIFIDHSSLTDWKEFDGNTCDILGTVFR
jgi:hypothetical protein